MTASTHTLRGQRRAELAAFLRSRRALITPDDAGLAPGLRRRTPGLRREEVAQLAGVGVTWYTWLEQGRPINASPQVLDAVAGVLRLDHAEHTHLYRLADVPEAPIPAAVTCLPPEVQVVLDGLATMPACVYNGKFDLLAWNASYATLFPSITAEGADRNALWDWFMNCGSDNPLGTADCLGQMVGIARSAYARHVGEPVWTDWVERMSNASPVFAAMWASNRVSEPMPLVKEVQCTGPGQFHARTLSLGVSGIPDARMIVYVPAGRVHFALLDSLRSLRLGRFNGSGLGRSAGISHGCPAAGTPFRAEMIERVPVDVVRPWSCRGRGLVRRWEPLRSPQVMRSARVRWHDPPGRTPRAPTRRR